MSLQGSRRHRVFGIVRTLKESNLRLVCLACLMGFGSAWGAEFRSVTGNGAILYDGPSFKATRVYLVGKNYPLEIISRSGEWLKVRDASGDFSWIAVNTVSEKRTVLITAALADIREAPQESSTVVFRAEKNVVLELVEPPTSTWVKVRHRDGQSGYVRSDHIWGL
jgi:SH3-like domain-containing protein